MGTLPYGAALGTDGNIKTGITSAIDGLLLSDLTERSADGTDGVVFTYLDYALANPAFRFNHNHQALDLKARFYAGILPTTNLGAPLKDGSADGTWDAQFGMVASRYIGNATVELVNGNTEEHEQLVSLRESINFFDTDTSMLVNFAQKSITTNPNDAVNFSDAEYGRVEINANFTAEGVIYGTSSWIPLTGKPSHGSVTGLIGSVGAVGAFVSDGTNYGRRQSGEYAGGFVAAPR